MLLPRRGGRSWDKASLGPQFAHLKNGDTCTSPTCHVGHMIFKYYVVTWPHGFSGARATFFWPAGVSSHRGRLLAPTSMGLTVMVKAESSQSISFSFPVSWSRMVRR